MKIAVLMGGVSKEREISLRSGGAVSAALGKKGHEVTKVDVKGLSFIDTLKNLKPEAAFVALHGRFGEDGTVQGILEWLFLPYTGPGVFSSALCFDKLATKEYLMPKRITSPAFAVYRKGEKLNDWCGKLSLIPPLIVKPNTEGSTIGVTRVFDKKELKGAVEEALQFDTTVLAEAYIEGRELTVGMHNGRALPVLEIVPKSGFYDYQSKYTRGATDYLVPASIPEGVAKKIQRMSEAAYLYLQCEGSVRVDYMLGKDDTPYLLEVNTIPGMTETSLLPKAAAAVGISFENLCDEMVKGARLKCFSSNAGP